MAVVMMRNYFVFKLVCVYSKRIPRIEAIFINQTLQYIVSYQHILAYTNIFNEVWIGMREGISTFLAVSIYVISIIGCPY